LWLWSLGGGLWLGGGTEPLDEPRRRLSASAAVAWINAAAASSASLTAWSYRSCSSSILGASAEAMLLRILPRDALAARDILNI